MQLHLPAPLPQISFIFQEKGLLPISFSHACKTIALQIDFKVKQTSVHKSSAETVRVEQAEM